MSLVADAHPPTDIALHELAASTDRPGDAAAAAAAGGQDAVAEPEPERTPHDVGGADANGDVSMAASSADDADAHTDDPAATDSGKENVTEDAPAAHATPGKDGSGGVKKILKSGVFGGQCSSPGSSGSPGQRPGR